MTDTGIEPVDKGYH